VTVFLVGNPLAARRRRRRRRRVLLLGPISDPIICRKHP